MTQDRPFPKVGVMVLVFKGNRVLLGKRRGSHGAGEYGGTGGHLDPMESFEACVKRETLEEAGIEIGNLRFLGVVNLKSYAPKHYVELGFAADWKNGEPRTLEPNRLETWGWYPLDHLPHPLYQSIPFHLEALRTGRHYWDG